MEAMLALVVAVLLTESSPLPKPFLGTRPCPVLPVTVLADCDPTTVARGSYWRPGGYARLTYYYRFPLGKGPTLAQIAKQAGFQATKMTFGPNPGDRVVRQADGVRQVIFVSDLKEGETWKVADLKGPATVVAVAEMPDESPLPKRWHHLPELLETPLPPGFPTPYRFLRNAPIYAVRSDPILPRYPRLELNVWVILSVEPDIALLESRADGELLPACRKTRRKKLLRYEFTQNKYGLIGFETLNDQPDPNRLLVQLRYRFKDRENGPRLE